MTELNRELSSQLKAVEDFDRLSTEIEETLELLTIMEGEDLNELEKSYHAKTCNNKFYKFICSP